MNEYIGVTSDHEMRTKLAVASVRYLEDDRYRVPLNQFIAEIQEPYIEIIQKLTSQLTLANSTVKNVQIEVKARKKAKHDEARNQRMKDKE